jgi:hypothetical protein
MLQLDFKPLFPHVDVEAYVELVGIPFIYNARDTIICH